MNSELLSRPEKEEADPAEMLADDFSKKDYALSAATFEAERVLGLGGLVTDRIYDDIEEFSNVVAAQHVCKMLEDKIKDADVDREEKVKLLQARSDLVHATKEFESVYGKAEGAVEEQAAHIATTSDWDELVAVAAYDASKKDILIKMCKALTRPSKILSGEDLRGRLSDLGQGSILMDAPRRILTVPSYPIERLPEANISDEELNKIIYTLGSINPSLLSDHPEFIKEHTLTLQYLYEIVSAATDEKHKWLSEKIVEAVKKQLDEL